MEILVVAEDCPDPKQRQVAFQERRWLLRKAATPQGPAGTGLLDLAGRGDSARGEDSAVAGAAKGRRGSFSPPQSSVVRKGDEFLARQVSGDRGWRRNAA
ncbi:hypothetical protein RJ55_02891 [Drechmeria coniospora]|nr:hypothetical protein RJ55_02891 [Drechmeria coniospora]